MAEIRVKETGTIKLFESDNTSSVTIASPASLGADRTITLPDADVTLASGTMATTNGITVADQWELNTGFTGDATPIAANLTQIDLAGMGTLGSAMTESSGIFTFPSTGIWYVAARGEWYLDTSGTANSRYNKIKIQGTTNDSSYVDFATSSAPLYDSGAHTYSNATATILVDVTDTANVKVRFNIDVFNTSVRTLDGGGSSALTSMTFIRLGDT